MKKRVTIIGGGPSGLTTAYHLSATPELRAQYDVTVYQMGWRLGGKGASGRDRDNHDRVLEHGLHILFGFYQNFFSMIREVYAANGREPHAKLATWRDAFHPHTFGVVEDFREGTWSPWLLEFPRNPETPGNGQPLNPTGQYVGMLLQFVLSELTSWRTNEAVSSLFYGVGERWERGRDRKARGRRALTRVLGRALMRALALARSVEQALDQLPLLVAALKAAREIAWRLTWPLANRDQTTEIVWMAVDFGISNALGVIHDRALEPGGCDKLDGIDYRAWLALHGAHPETLRSAFGRAIYDAAFSYARGDDHVPLMSAGVAIRTMSRMAFTYQGAMYYKMQAGMGDTVFGPLFQVLRDRGVKFAFFHKAVDVEPAADGSRIERVTFEVQARPAAGVFGYEPLFDVRGLPCWPSTPLYHLLENGDALRNINLESYYSGYHGVGPLVLEADKDFDTLVYAAPVQTIPFVAPKIVAQSPRWRRCVENVQAVSTVALQLWFKRDLAALGWPYPSPLLSVFTEPMNTWADMSQVLNKEDWPHDTTPLNVSYFCGPQKGPLLPPPATDTTFVPAQEADAKKIALDFVRDNILRLLPNTQGGTLGEFDWDQLFDLGGGIGEARFEAQYWRSNCEPHERCTLALPGTAVHRIHPSDTGYRNMTVAGDWVDNHFHAACMEGAVMGGILAARAVTGLPIPIVGEALDHGNLRD